MRAYRTVAIAALSVVVVATAVSGCGGDDDTTTGSGDTLTDATGVPAGEDAPRTVPSADDPLLGLVRDQPLEVGAVSLPDAGSGQPASVVPEPGRLSIVYFGYLSCPDVCPTTMNDLKNAYEQLDAAEVARLDTVFVTIDPARDTPEKLESYLAFFFDDARSLRSETRDQALQDAQDSFLATSSVEPRDDGDFDVTHSAVTYVVDPAGRVIVEWAFGTNADTIAHDLQILLARQSEEAA